METNTMPPSTEEVKKASSGQINRTVDRMRTMLEKHVPQYDSTTVQIILEDETFADELFQVFRKRVEAQSNMIMRHVRVDRSRKPQAMLDATGREQYTDKNVVKNIPQETAEEVDVYFFKLGRNVSCDDLEKEYELRGLKRDPYAQAAVNQADKKFADEHPNGSQWKDNGNWCYLAFNRWDGDRRNVDVGQNDNDWNVSWWFAGVRK